MSSSNVLGIETVSVEGQLPSSVAVVGLGYVGLPTALSLVETGIPVIGVDISETRLLAIKAQKVDLSDADRQRLKWALTSGMLTLTTNTAAVGEASFVLISVPTPVDAHLVPDVRAVTAACASVVTHVRRGQTIVLTSTTYVGCTRELLVEPLGRAGWDVGHEVFVAFSPERIDPGVDRHAPRETIRVVGGFSSRCVRRASAVLAHAAASVHPVSSLEAAELTKLLENTFRAVNIALINEFADGCTAFGADPMEIIEAATTKPYGFMPFRPGPGVGGHCIPCDTHYLLWQLRAQRRPAPLMDAAMSLIATRPRKVVDSARLLLADGGMALTGARVLVLGVAYKPGVADVRESPALEIIAELRKSRALVCFTDPFVPAIDVDGTTLSSTANPEAGDWDVVIVHTVQPGQDLDWLADQDGVLDTTYGLDPNLVNAHL